MQQGYSIAAKQWSLFGIFCLETARKMWRTALPNDSNKFYGMSPHANRGTRLLARLADLLYSNHLISLPIVTWSDVSDLWRFHGQYLTAKAGWLWDNCRRFLQIESCITCVIGTGIHSCFIWPCPIEQVAMFVNECLYRTSKIDLPNKWRQLSMQICIWL